MMLCYNVRLNPLSGDVTINDLSSPLSPPLSFPAHNDTCNGVALHPHWNLLATGENSCFLFFEKRRKLGEELFCKINFYSQVVVEGIVMLGKRRKKRTPSRFGHSQTKRKRKVFRRDGVADLLDLTGAPF